MVAAAAAGEEFPERSMGASRCAAGFLAGGDGGCDVIIHRRRRASSRKIMSPSLRVRREPMKDVALAAIIEGSRCCARFRSYGDGRREPQVVGGK